MGTADKDKLMIYTSQVSERLSYIVSVLFENVTVTSSENDFKSFTGSRINYSAERMGDDSFWIIPNGLLNESGIRHQPVIMGEWEGLPVFFLTQGDLPFDIFSASFYLLSRYEEYLPAEPDMYGRYHHIHSLAYQQNFLRLPLVNLWIKQLQIIWKRDKSNSPLTIHHSLFTFVPTYDIDIAYRYLHRPFWKNLFDFYKALFQGNFYAFAEMGNVYSGWKPDPFNTFGWLDDLHQQYHLEPVYFLLTIIRRGEYDKNLLAGSKHLQKLYQAIGEKYTTGLHPSWQSGTEDALLGEEKKKAEQITSKTITRSRNHYLRFTVPQTYRRLIAAGITHDYSMAYGSVNGFRASYAKSYLWYDLEKESVTDLTLHPFCFMEATSFFNQGHTALQAREEIQYYHDIVKQVDGELITLFHNHFLTEQPEWAEWRNMYSDFLEKNFG